MTSKTIHLIQTAENWENQAREKRKTNYLSKRLYSNIEDKFKNGKPSWTLWFFSNICFFGLFSIFWFPILYFLLKIINFEIN